MRSTGLTLLVIATLLVLPACAQPTASEDPSGQDIDADRPFPTFVRQESPGDGPEVALEGELTLDGGCLTVHPGASGLPDYGLVLPDDAIWDASTETVTLDGAPLTVGRAVSLGGGYRTLGDAALDHQCANSAEVFFVYTVQG
ncbi:hypothetical protein [Georgenia yuyongxinii]